MDPVASEHTLSSEDQKQVEEILSDFSPKSSDFSFSPMDLKYHTDLANLKEILQNEDQEQEESQKDISDSEGSPQEAADNKEPLAAEDLEAPEAPSLDQELPEREEDFEDTMDFTTPGSLESLDPPDSSQEGVMNLSSSATDENNLTEPLAASELGDLSQLETPSETIPAASSETIPADLLTPELGDLSQLVTPSETIPTASETIPEDPLTPELGDLSQLVTPSETIPTASSETIPADPLTPELGDLSQLVTPSETIPTTSETIPTTSGTIPADPLTPELGDLSQLVTPSETIPTASETIPTTSGTIPTDPLTPELGDLSQLVTPSETIPTTSETIPTTSGTIPADPLTPELDDLSQLVTPSETIPTTSETIPTDPLTPELGDLSQLETPSETIPTTSETIPTDPLTPELGDLSQLETPSETIPTASETIPADPLTPELGDLSQLETPSETIPAASSETIPADPLTPELGDLSQLVTPSETIPAASETIPTDPLTPELDDLSQLVTPSETIPTASETIPADPLTPELDDLSQLVTPSETIPTASETIPADPLTPELGDLSQLVTPSETIPTASETIPADPLTPELGDLSQLETPSETIPAASSGTIPADPQVSQETLNADMIQESLDIDNSTLKPDSAMDHFEPLGMDPLMPLESQDIGSLDGLESLASSDKSSGIDSEFTDEELANIRKTLLAYPKEIREAAINSIINEKVSQTNQRILMNMLADHASEEQIADFLEIHLGHRPDTTPSHYTKEGVEIIYTDDLSPELVSRRKRRNRILLAVLGLGGTSIVVFFAFLTIQKLFYVKNLYEKGLSELIQTRSVFAVGEREKRRRKAEQYFQQAVKKDNNQYDVEYLNRYGIAYMKAGFYQDGFTKLFGRAEPSYESSQNSAWNIPKRRAPRLRRLGKWKRKLGVGTKFTDQTGVVRRVRTAGAYMVDRLRDEKMKTQTLINLARYHSFPAKDFINGYSGKKYKNDSLGIEYYRFILTLMNQPHNIDSLAGIAKIYYNQKRYTKAASYYKKIIDLFPFSVKGQSGLLHTYIEFYKNTGDPRPALIKHREIQRAGLEKKLPLYLTTKLAGFYTDLKPDDVRIRYQTNPVDDIRKRDLESTAMNLLELLIHKNEKRDGKVIKGKQYAEGFYQRGRFLQRQGNRLRALKEFQKSYNANPKHYLSVNSIGEYYRDILNFDRASRYFEKSLETYQDFIQTAGREDEDEVLLQGEIGNIFFNIASLLFLRYSGNEKEGVPDSFIYPFRAGKQENSELKERRERLLLARDYFQKARTFPLKDTSDLAKIKFRMGWIDYINGNFASALVQWSSIEPIYQDRNLSLLMGQANSYFYTDQTLSALGTYLKIQSDLEKELEASQLPKQKLLIQKKYATLSAIYNNIGAVYERESQKLSRLKDREPTRLEQFKKLETDALIYYWKAVEAGRQANLSSEIARTNVQLAFKDTSRIRIPLLDDWVPPVFSNSKKLSSETL